jgi:hypothetical protein
MSNRNAPIQGVPIEVKFGKKIDTLWIHPDGAISGDAIGAQMRVEKMQAAAKRLAQVTRKLNAGTIDHEAYEEGKAKLDAAYEDAKKELTKPDDLRQLESQYKSSCAALLEARDGVPLDADEFEKLGEEQEKWKRLASIKPFAVPYLRSCVLSWTILKAEGDAEPMPITIDNLNSLGEDWLLVAFMRVSSHYEKEKDAEKKLNESLLNNSATLTADSVEFQIGIPSMPSPLSTDKTPEMSSNGESANSIAH